MVIDSRLETGIRTIQWHKSSLSSGGECVAWAFEGTRHVRIGHSRHLDAPVVVLSTDDWQRFTDSVAEAPEDSGRLPSAGPEPLLTWEVDDSGAVEVATRTTALPTFTPGEWRAFVQAIRSAETLNDGSSPRGTRVPT